MSVEKRTTDAIAIMAGGASALEKLQSEKLGCEK